MIWIFYIFVALIVWAFAIRVLIWFAKFIYSIAPILILWGIILLAIFYYDMHNGEFQKELRKDAGIVGTAEN